MQMPIALHPLPAAQRWAARAWARLVAAATAWTNPSRGAPIAPDARQRARAEDQALAGLSEHMLKDIGASSRLMANAASHPGDRHASAFDPGFH